LAENKTCQENEMTGHGRKMGNKGTVRKRGRKMTEKV
jgi:hypothetical protein